MLRHVTIASLLIGTLAAQTTWTSFEDRKGHAIASAPNGGLLMFGGESASSPGTLLDDTNEFTSAATNPLWRRLQPANPPTAREGHAMAAGIGASSLPIFVLFGGLAHGTTTPSGETFVYSGGWGTGSLPATRPSARTGHAMVTDTRRNRVVLFGGYSGGVAMNDVWEFDPVSLVWIPTTITTPMQQLPPPRYGHAMAFDPGTSPTDGRVYVFGGSPFTVNDQLWELQFDAATATAAWTDTMTPLARPSGRRSAAMAYLPAYGNLVLFGGEDSNLVPLGDTWSWNRTSNTWSQRSLATQPSARRDHAMALDAQGNNLVLLGGDDGTGQATRGTWLWNGVDWHQVGAPPPDRNDVAMAYDSARQRHVLFGGRNQANVFGETWELDGVNWIQRFPANTPSPRTEAGMAFDSARNRTVLYGGWDQTHCAAFGETWEWDGSNWLIRITPTTPPNAAGVQPVFDPDRGVTWMLAGADMWRYDGLDWTPALPPSSASAAFAYFPPANAFVLFGGQGPSAGTRNATWQLTGSAWTLRRPTNSPSARRSTAMAFDATTNRLVLFGGFDGSAILGDTWTWDGVTWTQASPATSPPIRADHAMVRDPVRDRIVLFGGNHASNPSLFRNDTWEWNGSSWLAVATATAPSPRSPRLAWDAARDRVVSFGGYAGAGTVLADTWEYDGSDWTQRTPATTAPPARRSHQMATDPATGYALVFGGWNGSGSSGTLFADTWIWDGADWTALPAAGPSARADAATAANPTAGILAVAGGLTGLSPTEFADDVWQWQTTSWTRSNRGSLPAPIYDYGAAYDERRGEVVVFGGQTDCSPISPVVIDDMWIWKEGAWEQRNPPFRPSPRSYDRLCYDAARDRVVLYGGNGGGTPLGDTWEWDGTRWTLRLPLASPPAGGGNGVSYDERQGVTVVYGSIGAFEYGPTSPARIVPFGSGCPGSAGIPSLAPKPWAGPWLGDRAEIDIVDAPPGLGLFVWGFSNTTWIGGALPFSLAPLGGGPGCNLLVSDTIVQLFVSNTNPYPYVSFVLPGDPSFLGAVMYAQAGFLDAGLGGAPVVSHGLELTFGAK